MNDLDVFLFVVACLTAFAAVLAFLDWMTDNGGFLRFAFVAICAMTLFHFSTEAKEATDKAVGNLKTEGYQALSITLDHDHLERGTAQLAGPGGCVVTRNLERRNGVYEVIVNGVQQPAAQLTCN